ncbi:CD29 [Mytilus edulis]|uniref:Integrin beta n=1 Tax=Mytilus edulis TaxID=6550 RepID=A0A8S3T6H2_MYTED|nr:CD29 [Mytilus edulis]
MFCRSNRTTNNRTKTQQNQNQQHQDVMSSLSIQPLLTTFQYYVPVTFISVEVNVKNIESVTLEVERYIKPQEATESLVSFKLSEKVDSSIFKLIFVPSGDLIPVISNLQIELTRTVFKIKWILLLIFLINCISVDGQCSGKRCGECIVSGPNCLWCKQKNYNETRCAVEATLRSNGCSSGDIVRHPVASITKIKDAPLQDGGVGVEPIQLQPQEVKIRLVPNKLFRWTFKYRVAENFPVDIYFLVDPSYTMRNLRTQLANLADDIGTSIRNLTTDFRFGYGTSMDKVTLPYTHTTPEYLQNPCPGDSSLTCAPPHSFLHRLNLTNNVQAFREAVRATETTANRDKTEGLLDGVMQVAVCGTQ